MLEKLNEKACSRDIERKTRLLMAPGAAVTPLFNALVLLLKIFGTEDDSC